MQTHRPPVHRPAHAGREGFTLIELMIVIVIIAAIAGLLLPAIAGARRGARITEVRNEISQLESAISDFKATFGVEPPSAITLHEQASGWATDPANRALIRSVFGNKYNFSVNRDINGDGDTNDTIVLKGDQCLVFFLGGMYDTSTGALTGFSSNPTNPFDRSSSGTRMGPFITFDPGRIRTSVTGVTYAANRHLDRFPVYVDKLDGQQRPYLYAANYQGQGYNDTATYSDIESDAAPNFRIYRTNTKNLATDPDTAPWKPQGVQIISPGFDGEYGLGGVFKPTTDIRLPALLRSGGVDVVDLNRRAERDNITNFHSGELDP